MSADTILRKINRAFRNKTGITFTANQVCELIDFGVLDTLTDIVNQEAKAEAKGRLEQSKSHPRQDSGKRRPPLTREVIEELVRKV